MSKIGFLGCGNMASAFICGITSRGKVPFEDILIYTRTKERAQQFISDGAVWCDTIAELLNSSDILFVCVKPQQVDEVLKEMASSVKDNTVIVTMLAGKTISYFKTHLGKQIPVIRIMPNTPLLLGCGAVALSADETVSRDKLDYVKDMIGLLGLVKEIPEEQMDTIVAVNGSSPAYFYLFIKSMAEWAQGHGVDYESALDLAVTSMLGSAKMLEQSGMTPDELIKAVSSPGGTTLAALSSFEKDGLRDVIFRGMDACENRSRQLSSM